MSLKNLSPANIIVRMPNWIGDAVMATPILADLRAHWPKARLTAMCQGPIAQLFTHDHNIDEIFAFQKPSGWIPHLHHGEVIEDLRHGQYDLGILLTNSFSSAWWFWKGNVQNRIGYSCDLRGWLLTEAVPFPKAVETQHLVTTYKMLLKPLGISVSDTDPYLVISREEREAAWDRLKRYGIERGKNIVVGINPGAAYGTAKCWLPDRFHKVTQLLIEDPNVYVLYFGDGAGAPLINDICRDFPERVVNLAGKTSLREFIALIQACNVLLTNDSGPMHIAAALKVPLLALFGSTSDVKTGPYHHGKVIHKHVECSPCYKRICPIDFRCMKRIEVDEVYRELCALLKQKSSNE